MTPYAIIHNTALQDGILDPLASFIAAQGAFESGGFESKTFRENNNSFGYKRYPGSEWQIGEGRTSTEGDHYAAYTSLEDSTHEITHWILRRQKEGRFPPDLATITSPLMYATYLKNCGYFGGLVHNYAKGLDYYLKRYSPGE